MPVSTTERSFELTIRSRVFGPKAEHRTRKPWLLWLAKSILALAAIGSIVSAVVDILQYIRG